ncbi:hypothetical protein ACJMK2_032311 [Sinanodonta woodiana]|uniref:Cytoskeleton-associated protein 2 C-terminal domain-containing protein n=1 Tax=Sinanodonta woodiana TaxID=1069815 RepID=A0ABD3X1B4_SINWO
MAEVDTQKEKAKSKRELYSIRLEEWKKQKQSAAALTQIKTRYILLTKKVMKNDILKASATIAKAPTSVLGEKKLKSVKISKPTVAATETPMSERLRRWKEQKQRELEQKKSQQKKPPLLVTSKHVSSHTSSEKNIVLASNHSIKKENTLKQPIKKETNHSVNKEINHSVNKEINHSVNKEKSVALNKNPEKLTRNLSSRERAKLYAANIRSQTSQPQDHTGIKNTGNRLQKRIVQGLRRSSTLNEPHKGNHTILKRRCSETVSCINPSKKFAGILKRKSCYARFVENENSSLDDVFEPNEHIRSGEKRDKPEVTCSHIPVAVITPGTSRNVHFLSPEHLQATPETKLRKSQTSMRAELDDWLKAKGRTPSKFRHLMCFDAEMAEEKNADPQVKPSLSVEELTRQQDHLKLEQLKNIAADKEHPLCKQLETVLQECNTLFEAGCPFDHIVAWLNSIYDKIPIARYAAEYYICKARVFKSTGDLDAVLAVFESAIINNAQPSEELATSIKDIVKAMSDDREKKAKQKSRTPQKFVVQENIFESSTIKYSVSKTAPYSESGKSKKRSFSASLVVTPVRRSTRRSLANLPDALKDKDTYDKLEDLSEADKENALFQPNKALEEEFNKIAAE